jgi:prepilin peptidase CpaA
MQELDALLQLLVMLVVDPRTMILFALLIAAAISDYRTYKIPNWLTVSGAVVGLLYTAVFPLSPQQGLLWSFEGLVAGFLFTLPFYALRTMGAGDVKLFAMVGAFLGFPAIFYAVICTFVVGGIVAMSFAVFHKVAGRMLSNIRDSVQVMIFAIVGSMKPNMHIEASQSVGKLPYGICICIGTIGFVVARQLGYM